jgi:uncharacterized membrane protein YidH (DUF202 family)
MDDITIDDDLGSENAGLTASMKANLSEAFKWMRTVAIIQFIFLGLGTLGMLFLLTNMPRGFGGVLFVQLLVLGGMFMLILTLFKAATAYKAYSTSGSNADLEKAFLKQKQFWLASGIIMIVVAALYGIMLLFMISSGGRMFM